MNRLYLALGGLLVILALSYTALHLYAGKVAATVKADIATQVITSAVAESKSSAIADYQTQAEVSERVDSVRPFLAIARKMNVQTPVQPAPVKTLGPVPSTPVPVDPWIGVFNNAVRASNSAIESSGSMPRGM